MLMYKTISFGALEGGFGACGTAAAAGNSAKPHGAFSGGDAGSDRIHTTDLGPPKG